MACRRQRSSARNAAHPVKEPVGFAGVKVNQGCLQWVGGLQAPKSFPCLLAWTNQHCGSSPFIPHSPTRRCKSVALASHLRGSRGTDCTLLRAHVERQPGGLAASRLLVYRLGITEADACGVGDIIPCTLLPGRASPGVTEGRLWGLGLICSAFCLNSVCRVISAVLLCSRICLLWGLFVSLVGAGFARVFTGPS